MFDAVRKFTSGGSGGLTTRSRGIRSDDSGPLDPAAQGGRPDRWISRPRGSGRGSGRSGPRPRRSARRSLGGVGSSTTTWWSLPTSNTPGASDSQTPWPWQRSVSTTIRIRRLPCSAARHRPPAVADDAGLLELDDHLRVVVAVGLGRLGRLELPVQEEHEKMALSCIRAKAWPTQRWRPAPKGIHVHGLCRSSSRGSR